MSPIKSLFVTAFRGISVKDFVPRNLKDLVPLGVAALLFVSAFAAPTFLRRLLTSPTAKVRLNSGVLFQA